MLLVLNEVNIIPSFLDELKKQDQYTQTENLAKTLRDSQSALLNFFGLGGALRTRTEQEIISLFSKAFVEAPLLALKCLFYFRDIRGGQGERRTFRILYKYLAKNYSEIALENMGHIQDYGRWDDLYCLFETPLNNDMLSYILVWLNEDLKTEQPSLLGKWLKSENTSSKESRRIARHIRIASKLSPKQYRQALSKLRSKIRIVEKQMCARQWDKINYEAVPSRAAMIYRNAFRKHDPERYEQYLTDVKNGIKTIKTQTLYPYDLLRNIVNNEGNDKTLDLQWENLPDYCEGNYENSIVVCDTSGSMHPGYTSRGDNVAPIYIAVSLAIYLGERIEGLYKNHFITFSMRPRLQEIVGNNLYEKYINLYDAEWDGNTNLQAVFDLLLEVAQASNISQDEMIKKIYIISDMEFDEATPRNDYTNFEVIKQKYKDAGYEMPHLVFWNVEARQDQFPIRFDEQGTQLISGCSPSIMKSLLSGNVTTPYDLMLEVLNNERYDRITL